MKVSKEEREMEIQNLRNILGACSQYSRKVYCFKSDTTLDTYCDADGTYYAMEHKPRVYCNVAHVSRSGMQRRIRFYVVAHGDILDITRSMSYVIGWSENNDGLKVDGCGMDMRFHTLDILARSLGIDGITSGNDFDIRSL